MIKIKAQLHKIEKHEVEINEDELFNAFLNELKKRNADLIPYDHINNKGSWMRYTFSDGHNGDEHYEEERKATRQEVEFANLCYELRIVYYTKR